MYTSNVPPPVFRILNTPLLEYIAKYRWMRGFFAFLLLEYWACYSILNFLGAGFPLTPGGINSEFFSVG